MANVSSYARQGNSDPEHLKECFARTILRHWTRAEIKDYLDRMKSSKERDELRARLNRIKFDEKKT